MTEKERKREKREKRERKEREIVVEKEIEKEEENGTKLNPCKIRLWYTFSIKQLKVIAKKQNIYDTKGNVT